MSHELRFWRRRDFLTQAGFAVAAAALDGCSRAAVQKAIPFVTEPETVVPGVATWYATTCGGCSSGCAVLVKTRDGRPIKIEGHDRSALFGGTCAVGQAAVLSLYDGERLRGPHWRSQPASWGDVDAAVERQLAAAAASGRSVVLLSGTIISPSTKALLGEWSRRFRGFRHVTYDAVSSAALRNATLACFGTSGAPHYRFDRADAIVALEADFLGTWLSPVEFTRQYAARRRPNASVPMLRHVHFESGVSLTGSNADERFRIAPSELGHVAVAMLEQLGRRAGVLEDGFGARGARHLDAAIAAAAEGLWRRRGRSVVVTGSQDTATQIVVHAINTILGNIGTTVEIDRLSHQKQGDDEAMARLVADMDRGDVDVLMVHGANPAYDYADPERFARAMASVSLTVSFSDRLDETSSRADVICPDHHFLEAWGDAEPVSSSFTLSQPTLAPLFDTRSMQDSLLKWLGGTTGFYTYIRKHWRENIFPPQEHEAGFDALWDRTLHDGVFDAPPAVSSRPVKMRADWRAAAFAVTARDPEAPPAAGGGLELHLYEPVALRDGRHANNPWLQELPDPITKITWGNYATLDPDTAARLHIAPGDVVRISDGDLAIELPAHIDPGQAPQTVSVGLGYGRTRAGKVGTGVGVNAFPLATCSEDTRRYVGAVTVSCTGRREALATTQEHQSMEGRPIVKQMTSAALRAELSTPRLEDRREPTSLWPERVSGDHQWGMTIDLNACTGCSACVTACQAENNVPVVGRDEVRRGREMHWLRIDTYLTGAEAEGRRVMQPMMCQHCQNAPCETVCPVLATVHSSDGINQQIYNRCIGTRYCANNCPYKVRRFNWFEYAQNERFDFNMNDPVGRMVLNPDVVVRSRGVMEKCSLCVQRIQAGKLVAQQEERPLADGDIKTACQQACPAQAIVFGDLADPSSLAARLRADQRHYLVLGELGTKPHVGYLAKVRNGTEEDAS